MAAYGHKNEDDRHQSDHAAQHDPFAHAIDSHDEPLERRGRLPPVFKIVTDRFDARLRQAFAYAARLTAGIVLLYRPIDAAFPRADGA